MCICGKGSTEVRITQIKGKESENSYQKIEEVTVGQAHANTYSISIAYNKPFT